MLIQNQFIQTAGPLKFFVAFVLLFFFDFFSVGGPCLERVRIVAFFHIIFMMCISISSILDRFHSRLAKNQQLWVKNRLPIPRHRGCNSISRLATSTFATRSFGRANLCQAFVTEI